MLTDLELTRLCAEAMRLPDVRLSHDTALPHTGTVWTGSGGRYGVGNIYNPLHNDEQAMALVKKFGLGLLHYGDGQWAASYHQADDAIIAIATGINRAIVECVAKMQTGKE